LLDPVGIDRAQSLNGDRNPTCRCCRARRFTSAAAAGKEASTPEAVIALAM
jgi:hypothetical protein